jgi:hypothetical protein
MKNELCRDGVQQASLSPRQKQRQSLLEQNVQKMLEEKGFGYMKIMMRIGRFIDNHLVKKETPLLK